MKTTYRSLIVVLLLFAVPALARGQDLRTKADPALYALYAGLYDPQPSLPPVNASLAEDLAVQGLETFLAAGKTGSPPTVSVFIRLQQASDVAAVWDLGVEVGTELGDLLTAR